jgi:glycosyltransferase involved in cell wall biosynthesis
LARQDHVLTVQHGFDPRPFQTVPSPAEKKRAINQHQLPPHFILSVGHLEPRKNYERLLAAFRKIRQSGNPEYKLVIVGQVNQKSRSIFKTVKALNLDDAVIFTGFVPEAQLAALYHLADVFVLPSRYEGFGFPPLESMAAGTPVVCANATSLPEICGDGAFYFNPLSVEDMHAKIEHVLNDTHIQQQLKHNGRQRLRDFSWEICAEKTALAYRTFGKGTH